jgi:transcriptional regulator with XRE-family HTH domain
MDTLGKRLRIARSRKQYTQMQLAKMVNANRVTISDYERDRSGSKRPNLVLLIKFAKVLDTSLDYLLLGK